MWNYTSVGFIQKEFITMRVHMNIKKHRLSLGYVTHMTARTIFVRHRSGTGIRRAFTEKNRADDVTSPSCFYFMEMAEEGEGMIKMISTGPAQLSFDKIKSQNIFITYTCL